jgi:hypothetical protein
LEASSTGQEVEEENQPLNDEEVAILREAGIVPSEPSTSQRNRKPKAALQVKHIVFAEDTTAGVFEPILCIVVSHSVLLLARRLAKEKKTSTKATISPLPELPTPVDLGWKESEVKKVPKRKQKEALDQREQNLDEDGMKERKAAAKVSGLGDTFHSFIYSRSGLGASQSLVEGAIRSIGS